MSDKTDPKESCLVPVGSKALTIRSSASLNDRLNRLFHGPVYCPISRRSIHGQIVWPSDPRSKDDLLEGRIMRIWAKQARRGHSPFREAASSFRSVTEAATDLPLSLRCARMI